MVITCCIFGGVMEILSVGKDKVSAVGSILFVAVPIGLWLIALIAIALSVKHNEKLAQLVEPKIARLLGNLTYPLYLLHTTVGAALLFSSLYLGLNRWASLGIAISGSLGASWLVCIWPEQVIRRWLASLYDFLIPARNK